MWSLVPTPDSQINFNPEPSFVGTCCQVPGSKIWLQYSSSLRPGSKHLQVGHWHYIMICSVCIFPTRSWLLKSLNSILVCYIIVFLETIWGPSPGLLSWKDQRAGRGLRKNTRTVDTLNITLDCSHVDLDHFTMPSYWVLLIKLWI